jgi:hypothetical protein
LKNDLYCEVVRELENLPDDYTGQIVLHFDGEGVRKIAFTREKKFPVPRLPSANGKSKPVYLGIKVGGGG